jgi:hypothetical protein
MNQELIEGLFQQAGGRIQRDSSGTVVLTYSEECDPYEFARLIVQECLKVAKDKVSGFYPSQSWTDIARDETALAIYKDIKQHFGVAE